MMLHTTPPSEDNSSLYLKRLESLVAEIGVGIEAISANSLEALRKSITRQTTLCDELAALGIADGTRLRDLSQSARPPRNESIELAIWNASNTVRQLNLRYDALLQHSGKTVSMLAALCDNYLGIAIERQGQGLKQQTWSCEI